MAEDVKDVVEGAGATWRPWRRPGSEETGVYVPLGNYSFVYIRPKRMLKTDVSFLFI